MGIVMSFVGPKELWAHLFIANQKLDSFVHIVVLHIPKPSTKSAFFHLLPSIHLGMYLLAEKSKEAKKNYERILLN